MGKCTLLFIMFVQAVVLKLINISSFFRWRRTQLKQNQRGKELARNLVCRYGGLSSLRYAFQGNFRKLNCLAYSRLFHSPSWLVHGPSGAIIRPLFAYSLSFPQFEYLFHKLNSLRELWTRHTEKINGNDVDLVGCGYLLRPLPLSKG